MNNDWIPFNDLPKHYGNRNGRRISKATFYRWRTKGLAGVRLQCEWHAGEWFVTPQALREFDRAVTAAKSGQVRRTTKARPSATRRKKVAAEFQKRVG